MTRASVGAAAHRLRDVPLLLRPLLDESFADMREALDIVPPRALVVVDSLQLTPAPRPAARVEERVALSVRALKGPLEGVIDYLQKPTNASTQR